MASVEAVLFLERTQPMYNLTVAEAHTFFVGDGQWLVHNDECTEQFDGIFEDPNQLSNTTPDNLKSTFEKNADYEVGTLGKGRRKGQGLTIRERNVSGSDYTDRYVQYHPGTPRHFDGKPYWKISSGKTGTIWIDEDGNAWKKPPSREHGRDVPGIPYP